MTTPTDPTRAPDPAPSNPAPPVAAPPTPRKRRRWLRWLILTLIVLPIALWIVGTRSFVTRKTILALAGSKIGAVLTASSVVVELDGTIILRDAIARAPGIPGEGGILFSVHRLEITVDWSSVFDSVPRFTNVILDAPLLRVSQDATDGSLNIDKLQITSPTARPKLGNPPIVTIIRGVLELGENAGENYTSLRRLDVEGSIKRSTSANDVWLIALNQIAGPSEASPLKIAGQIDPKGLSLSMDGITLGEWTDANVPTLLRQTFRQLALQGRVGKSTFALSESGEMQATLELAGMSLNLPVDTQPEEDSEGNKLPLPADQVGRQLRMQDVKGTLSYTDGFISGDFTGNLEELPYHVKLSYGGTSAIAPFTLELTASGFELRKNPQIMRFAPGVAQRRFAQFSHPTGIVDATVTVRRPAPIDGKEADLSVTGDIVMHDGSASFERFPYLFEKMRGHWRFSEDELEIVQLQGEAASGARCFGYGRISPLTDDAGADIQVEITDLPIDDTLVQALGSKRKIVDALFNKDQYQQLVDQGLVISPKRRDELTQRLGALKDAPATNASERSDIESELRRPVFAFGGKARVYVEVQRAVGPQGIWLDTITISLPNAGILPEKFPFPLVAQDLTIVKQNDTASVTNGVLTGLNGGKAVANATVDLLKIEEPNVPFVPEITLRGSNVPVDALLVHAVPESLSGSTTSPRTILKSLGVAGHIASADVRIGMTPTDDVGYTVALDVTQGRARPVSSKPTIPGPRLGAHNLEGKVRLTQDRLTMDMKGDVFRLDTPDTTDPVSFTADIGFEEGKDTTYTSDIRADRYDLSLAVEDLVAPISPDSAAKIRELRDSYFPTGELAAQVHLESAPAPAAPSIVHIVATNPSVDFDFEKTRVALHDAKGKVTIDVGTPGKATFDSLEGDLIFDAAAGGRVSLSGATTLDLALASDTEPLSITLAHALFEAPLTRRVVEKAMSLGALSWYDRLRPRGTFATRVVLTPDPSTGQHADNPSPDAPSRREWLVEGSFVPESLTIATGAGDVPFTSVAGTATFRTGGGAVHAVRLASDEWTVEADGSWTGMADGSTSVHMDLSGNSRSLPPSLLSLLPPEISELASDLKFEVPGTMTLTDSTLAMILPAEQPGIDADTHPDQTRFTGTFETRGASADLGVAVSNLNAAASITYDSADGVGDYDVRLLAESATLEGVDATQGRARVTGQTGGDTYVPLISADCHGGRIAGTATIRPRPDGRKSFVVDARVSDARFASIFADIKANRKTSDAVVEVTSSGDAPPAVPGAPPTSEAAPRPNSLDESRGRVDAEFSLAGIVNDARSRRGRGTLIIGGERVINIPLLVPLMRISNLQLPIDERLDFASARFFLSGETINLEEMIVSSQSVAIEGVGTATMPNYDLDLRFQAKNKTGIPIISRIVQLIRNELVTGEVRGTLADPKMKLIPFAGTRRLMNAAIGKDRTEPQRWLDELEAQPRVPVSRPSGSGGVVAPGS